jgi:hypothetical protein
MPPHNTRARPAPPKGGGGGGEAGACREQTHLSLIYAPSLPLKELYEEQRTDMETTPFVQKPSTSTNVDTSSRGVQQLTMRVHA